MKISKLLAFTAILVLSLSTLSVADDLMLIRLNNQTDLDHAQALFGTALAKVENGFLVSADQVQLGRLVAEGVEYELVWANIESASVALALSERSRLGRVTTDLSQLGRSVTLGYRADLLEISPTLARSVSETSELKVIPLEGREVPFHLTPKTFPNAQLELLDFPTDSLADLISQDSIYAFDQHLQDYQTRYVWTNQIDQARDWMIGKLQSWGYTSTVSQPFSWNGGWHYNVMATKTGYAEPENVIVIGGHYDSWNSQSSPYSYAPGADDNGSGTSVTLELARVLADIPLRKTIIFMPFSAEEVGLVGSDFAAGEFAAAGVDIEVMFNFDMVGYDPGNNRELELQSGPNNHYLQVHAAAATRVSNLSTFVGQMGSSSDHHSFYQEGFTIVNNIEGNFNTPGWHTDADLTSNINFDFLTNVARTGVASIAVITKSASPLTIEFIADGGDGQSLEIFWDNCHPDYDYTIYYGTYPGAKTDSVVGISSVCSYTIDGLTTGVTYYFTVYGTLSDGYPSLYAVGASEKSLVIPRTPAGLVVAPALGSLQLSWTPNIENDLMHYNLYRRYLSFDWELYQTGLTNTYFTDQAVPGGIQFFYRLTAVDLALNESEPSEEQFGYPATFDQGVLLVDELAVENWATPEQPAQEAWFDTIFSGASYGLEIIEDNLDAMSRNSAGPYSSIIWLDDDYSYAQIARSQDSIAWYLGYGNNMLLAGWQTLWGWSSSPNIDNAHLLYTEFGLTYFEINIGLDFTGATGQNGWPTITVDPSRGYMRLPMIPKLEYRAGAEVIYTFNSFSNSDNFQDQPVGIAYNTSGGKRILLGFPLYYLTPNSARALIAKAMEYFDEEIIIIECCGEFTGGFTGNIDCDSEGTRNLTDITRLIDRVYVSHTLLCCEENGDIAEPLDGAINLADITRLIDNVYVSKDQTAACQ